MGRVVGLPLLLVTLVIGAVLFVQQNKTQGPTSRAVTNDEAAAVTASAGTVFGQVTEVLAADQGATGTYVGAELPAGTGVVLAQATPTAYCLQATIDGTVMHEVGPGGSPATGPC